MDPRPHRSSSVVRSLAAGLATIGLMSLAACGGDDDAAPATTSASAVSSSAAPAAAASPRLLSAADAQAFLAAPPDGLTVLDVRTADEFAAGHLDGAVVIDFQSQTFGTDVDALPHDQPVFVYCHSGNRSAQAVAAMVQLGFTDITELDGGITAWQAAGLPVVTG
jgi:phage shock protein E